MYDEVDLVAVDRFLPDFLTKPRIAGIRLFEWLALAAGGSRLSIGCWGGSAGCSVPLVAAVASPSRTRG